MHIKKYFALLVVTAVFSCNTPEKRANLSVDNTTKDSIGTPSDNTSVMNQVIASYNEIQTNLDEIKSKENLVCLNPGIELQKPQKEQIITDIQSIYSLLKKNRASLNAMKEQLKNSNLKAEELQKLNDNLNRQLSEQEIRIENLRAAYKEMNIELGNLSDSLTKEQLENAKKTVEINTAYCAIGTHEQLVNMGLIVNKGGIFGLGDIPAINPELRRSMFSYIGINTAEISIASKKVKLIGLHPASSFRLEDTKLMIKKLVITDPTAFWGTSKYLVIEVE